MAHYSHGDTTIKSETCRSIVQQLMLANLSLRGKPGVLHLGYLSPLFTGSLAFCWQQYVAVTRSSGLSQWYIRFCQVCSLSFSPSAQPLTYQGIAMLCKLLSISALVLVLQAHCSWMAPDFAPSEALGSTAGKSLHASSVDTSATSAIPYPPLDTTESSPPTAGECWPWL